MGEAYNSTHNSSAFDENSGNVTPNVSEITTVSGSGGGSRISASVIVISAILLVFAAVSAVSNFLVLLSYKYEKKLHSNFVILIVNQAVADFIVSIIS